MVASAAMDVGLSGCVVWITGASGALGLATARAFGVEGARLLLQAHGNRDALERFAAAEDAESEIVVADVTDAEAVAAVARRGIQRFGSLDVLVAGAGVWSPKGAPLHRSDPRVLGRIVAVDLLGAMFCARAFLAERARLGRTAPAPSILFVGSTAGRFGEEGHAAYASAKAGLRGLTLTLKNEIVRLHPAGRVNLLEPGWVPTGRTRVVLEDPDAVERIRATRALRDFPSPEEVARAAVFLSSPVVAGHLSGECVAVAGGMEGRLLWPAPSEAGLDSRNRGA